MIISFYSYKGGVGRTQLVANLAAYLCYYEAKKVLLIDWDLEAPGLDTYFRGIRKKTYINILKKEGSDAALTLLHQEYPENEEVIALQDELKNYRPKDINGIIDIKDIERFYIQLKDKIENQIAVVRAKPHEKGLIEFLSAWVELISTTTNSDKLTENQPNYQDYLISVIPQTTEGGKIDIIPAGKFDDDYPARVNDFDWDSFKERHYGIGFIEEYWKPQLKNGDYDYVLIDSRTGISDYSGICNILMPDANVILVAPNIQNIEGTQRVAQKIVNSGYVKDEKRKPLILPLLSRVDTSVESATQKLHVYKEQFIEAFLPIVSRIHKGTTLLDKETYTKWNDSYILEYKRDLAVGENILFEESKPSIENDSLAEIFVRVLERIKEMEKEGKIDFSVLPVTRSEDIPLAIDTRKQIIASLILVFPSVSDIYGHRGTDQEWKQISALLHKQKFDYSLSIKNKIIAHQFKQLLLEEKPIIIHFANSIYFYDKYNDSLWEKSPKKGEGIQFSNLVNEGITLNNEMLESIFEVLTEDKDFSLTLVIASSIFSEQQVKILRKYIPFVIWRQDSIEKNNKNQTLLSVFFDTFYRNLDTLDKIEYAFKLAINDLKLNGMEEESLPILYKKTSS